MRRRRHILSIPEFWKTTFFNKKILIFYSMKLFACLLEMFFSEEYFLLLRML